ncbi:MAG TPA: hypothetical protein PKD64_11390 [Pirellulaceae bacterium]|nr:hypothetical protein [Pirellulaceae bacterium]HMO92786.1 hypothetical protein [Pirellulaceae bacterium]HMP69368.1 hypothetical protein [Pirellulaceae bacterium]
MNFSGSASFEEFCDDAQNSITSSVARMQEIDSIQDDLNQRLDDLADKIEALIAQQNQQIYEFALELNSQAA